MYVTCEWWSFRIERLVTIYNRVVMIKLVVGVSSRVGRIKEKRTELESVLGGYRKYENKKKNVPRE
jgi:hypothetical protein